MMKYAKQVYLEVQQHMYYVYGENSLSQKRTKLENVGKENKDTSGPTASGLITKT